MQVYTYSYDITPVVSQPLLAAAAAKQQQLGAAAAAAAAALPSQPLDWKLYLVQVGGPNPTSSTPWG